jgi:hypothetical protein
MRATQTLGDGTGTNVSASSSLARATFCFSSVASASNNAFVRFQPYFPLALVALAASISDGVSGQGRIATVGAKHLALEASRKPPACATAILSE